MAENSGGDPTNVSISSFVARTKYHIIIVRLLYGNIFYTAIASVCARGRAAVGSHTQFQVTQATAIDGASKEKGASVCVCVCAGAVYKRTPHTKSSC